MGSTLGYFGSVEISKTSNGFHPHIHIIAFSTVDLDSTKLLQDWQACGGEHIEIPMIDGVNHLGNLTRYIHKPINLTGNDLVKFSEHTYHKHLSFTGGVFRGLPMPDKTTDYQNTDLYPIAFYEYSNNGYIAV